MTNIINAERAADMLAAPPETQYSKHMPPRYSSRGQQLSYKLGTLLAIMMLALSFTAGNAWSFESQSLSVNMSDASAIEKSRDGNKLITKSPPPSMADTCLPLLHSIRHTAPTSAMDRNQRAAGAATALGLVIGVRFALSPPKKAGSRRKTNGPAIDLWQTEGVTAGNRHALAVSAYRQCQKEQALKALQGFSWKRK